MSSKTANLKVRVSDSTKLQLENLAHASELDVSDVVREALREYLDRRQKREQTEQGELLEVGK